MAKTIDDPSKYPNGIIITSGTDLPLYVDGFFSVGADYTALGVYVDGFAEITNNGVLSGAHGILLTGNGFVTNEGTVTGLYYGAIDLIEGGTVRNDNLITTTGTGAAIYIENGIGSVYNHGRITADTTGIYITKAVGTVSNVGVIEAVRSGVHLQSGGYIENLGTIASQTGNAVLLYDTARVSNSGVLITNGGTNSAVALRDGGSVANLAGGTISSANRNGVYISGGTGAVAGYVSNAAGGLLTSQGLITGYRGVLVVGGFGSVSNAGVIVGVTKSAVALDEGGNVGNGASATIVSRGTADAVYTEGRAGTVLNAGLISVVGGGFNGIDLQAGGFAQNLATGTIASVTRAIFANGLATVTNAGLLTTSGTSSEIQLKAGGTIVNLEGGTVIGPDASGIYIGGAGSASGTVLNSGSIIAGAGTSDGMHIVIDGYVNNAVGGLITGTAFGVHATGPAATVTNAGSIIASSTVINSTPIGIDFGNSTANAGLLNAAGGVVSGAIAVRSYGAETMVQNAATLAGGMVGVYLASGGQVVNQTDAMIAGTGVIPGDPAVTGYGIKLGAGGGTVSNLGTITGRNDGIVMTAGGVLKNQVGGTIGIVIQVAPTTYDDVKASGTVAATVVNAGTIGAIGPIPVSGSAPTDLTGVNGATGVQAAGGLYLNNLATGLIAGAYGISSTSGPASITNSGTVWENQVIPATGHQFAVSITGTNSSLAYVSNALGGLISSYGTGIRFSGIAGTAVNAGTVVGAVGLNSGGSLLNQSTGLVGQVVDLAASTTSTTVTNAGTIMGRGISIAGDGSSNQVTNQSGGTISSVNFGVEIVRSGTVVNAGTISIQSGNNYSSPIAVAFNPASIYPGNTYADYLTNAASGIVNGGLNVGVFADNRVTLDNSGMISGGQHGVKFLAGGVVVNTAAGSISGVSGDYSHAALASTLINAGAITAPSGLPFTVAGLDVVVNQAGGRIATPAILLGASGTAITSADTVVNAGIIGSAEASGSLAIQLNAQAASSLVLDPGGVIYGAITGGGGPGAAFASTLELAAGHGRLAGLGSTITNFSTIQFDPGAAWTIEGASPGLVAQINGFAGGDAIDIDGFAATKSSYLNGVLSLTSALNGQVTLALPGTFSAAQFIVIPDATGTGTDVTLACFAAGTRIETPDGPVAIEVLAVGDLVLAHDGSGAIGPQPIAWIGHRTVDCRRHPTPSTVWPIRISAGALGDGLPHRDLFLSPYHSLFLQAVLIPVKLLVNGTSIAQVPRDVVTYYHIELPVHGVLLAEGAAAESYLNGGDRSDFAEATAMTLFPDFASHLWEASGCAPLTMSGPKLNAARARVMEVSGLVSGARPRLLQELPRRRRRLRQPDALHLHPRRKR